MSRIRKLGRFTRLMARTAVGNPKRLAHIFGSALAAAEGVADRAYDLERLPKLTVEELLPPAGTDLRATLALIPQSSASISVLECISLILLLKKVGARNIFEFGTYKGISITQLALNMPENSRIYTLDLPDDEPRSAFAITDPEDVDLAHEKGKGEVVPADVRHRIQFLKQDSAAFDEKPLAGQMDLVFVDGAHNEAYVRNDSEKAWGMTRPGGIVVWHDSRAEDPAVVRYLLECPFKPVRIHGTSLAFATKP
jgi:predicted O-methyltransferase YrrM